MSHCCLVPPGSISFVVVVNATSSFYLKFMRRRVGHDPRVETKGVD